MDDSTSGAPTPDATALAIERAVRTLHQSHPLAPIVDVFNEVMAAHRGRSIEFGGLLEAATGGNFIALVTDAFAPLPEAVQRLLDEQSSDFDFDYLEFQPYHARSRFLLAYELNGYLGRDAWSAAFADRLLARLPIVERAEALAHGARLWDGGQWQVKPWAAADWT